MKAFWAPGAVAAIALAFAGCNSGSQQQPRTFQGQINLSDYSVSQPVVLVESSDSLGYVAQVSASGSFSITVPSGQSFRLTLADQTTGGQLALASRILWSAKGQTFVWAKIGNGSTINFGLIRPLGASVSRASDDGGEKDDGECDDDDDDRGRADGGASCPPRTQPPMQPPSNPPLCMPSTSVGSSKGDRDEDGEEDDRNYGGDDRDGTGGSAAQCSDGGVMVSGGDDSQRPHNARVTESESDDDGARCVKHVPTCPPAPAPGGGTTPPGGGTPPPSGGTPPPPGSPDMGTPAPGPGPIP
jgi:hypothetical protein